MLVSETLFKTLIIVASIIMLFYLVFGFIKKVHVFEGLENQTSETRTNLQSGEAGNASKYAANLKSEVIKMQDSLLISKYRKDYENSIINLEDLINYNMLKLMLNIDKDLEKDVKKIETLNIMHNAKASLNGIMKFVDGQ